MKLRNTLALPTLRAALNSGVAGFPARAMVMAGLIGGAFAVSATPARADDFVDRVNQSYGDIAPSRRSDLTILPVLAAMERAPRSLTAMRPGLLPKGGPGWTEAAAWAGGANQQAAIAALKKVTSEDDWKKAFGFGLPYGAELVPPDFIRQGTYVELDDPPTLAAKRFLYLPTIENLRQLVHVEATRIAAEGKPTDAIELLVHWVYFGRQLADRQFTAESRVGLESMIETFERIRDIAYQDARDNGGKKLDQDRLVAVIKKIDPEAGVLDFGRLKLPTAEREAANQLIAKLYKADGSIDARIFSQMMAKVGSAQFPLRLFSESAKWRSAAGSQISSDVAKSTVGAVYDDFQVRWNLDPYDPRLAAQPGYAKLQSMGQSAAVVQTASVDLMPFFVLRKLVRLEAEGTRNALGLVGLTAVAGNLPPTLSAIRPRYQKQLGDDPFNAARERGAKPPFEYFVPQRDTASKDPYEIRILTGEGKNFSVKLLSDVFVLYSLGADNAKNLAKSIQNTGETVAGADYLIYPPLLSLERQYQMDRGDIKVDGK